VEVRLGTGYKADTAALAMSILSGLSIFGKLGMGFIADRISARLTLALNFAAGALAFLLVLSVAHVFLLVVFVLVAGVALYAPVMLLPLAVAESLGRRRYGVLGALTLIAQTFGLAIGPVVAGRIFDLTGNYAGGFELFVILNAIGAVAAFACRPHFLVSASSPRRTCWQEPRRPCLQSDPATFCAQIRHSGRRHGVHSCLLFGHKENSPQSRHNRTL
jgi:MFS family permease